MTAAKRKDAGGWSDDAKDIARQARGLSGAKLYQAVLRLHQVSKRSMDDCWRLVLRMMKIRDERRRWTESEIDELREHM